VKKEELISVLKIQEIDQKLKDLERHLKKLEKEKESVRVSIESLKKRASLIESKRNSIKKELRDLREALEREEELLRKAEEKMKVVRKEHEYRMLLREKSRHEDSVLKLLYRIEDVEKLLSDYNREATEELNLIKKKLKEIEYEKEELKKEEESIKNRIKELELEKEKTINTLNPEVINFYYEAKKVFGDLIIAKIEEGICNGCGLKIPNILFSKLMKHYSVERCPNCGRYIYYRL